MDAMTGKLGGLNQDDGSMVTEESKDMVGSLRK